jgi:hypothetical protein
MAAAVSLCSDTANTAGGGLPNSDEPILMSANAVKEFQLALYLENLESFYFQSGLQNISLWEGSDSSNDTTEIIGKIAAVSCITNQPMSHLTFTLLQQEEVHIATITDLLNAYGTVVIPPCQYVFLVTSTDEFLELGDLITSARISAIIGLAGRISETDPLLIRSVSSIVTVNSRHDAFFRQGIGSVPNPTPFDTGINGIWAYNLAFGFVVPGSCPVEIPIPILPILSVSSPLTNTPSANTTAMPTVVAPYGNTTTGSVGSANGTVGPSQIEFS